MLLATGNLYTAMRKQSERVPGLFRRRQSLPPAKTWSDTVDQATKRRIPLPQQLFYTQANFGKLEIFYNSPIASSLIVATVTTLLACAVFAFLLIAVSFTPSPADLALNINFSLMITVVLGAFISFVTGYEYNVVTSSRMAFFSADAMFRVYSQAMKGKYPHLILPTDHPEPLMRWEYCYDLQWLETRNTAGLLCDDAWWISFVNEKVTAASNAVAVLHMREEWHMRAYLIGMIVMSNAVYIPYIHWGDRAWTFMIVEAFFGAWLQLFVVGILFQFTVGIAHKARPLELYMSTLCDMAYLRKELEDAFGGVLTDVLMQYSTRTY